MLIKLLVGLGLLGYMASRSPLEDLKNAFLAVRFPTIAWGLLLYAGSMWIAGLRWRVLFAAYGARRTFPVRHLVSLYMTGLFFNTFLPGAVGGDVLRAHLVRGAYDSPLASYAAVLLERVFGFAALACLSALALTARLSTSDASDFAPYLIASGVAVAATIGGALQAPAIARRLATRLQERGRIGQLFGLLARTPDLARPGLLVWAMALSFGTQLVGVFATYLVTRDLCPSVTFVDCLLYVPLANIASYFPMTFGGLGAREATFVALFARIGVPEPSALATSLVVFGLLVALALAGGVIHLISPVEIPKEPPGALPDS
ncbi:MAG: flippase-like domain-containing protein [Deltaproteobacteria bacterium]|nr:flippase-like domain-containing protein [Deltaproteobacteria bacterium]